MNYLDFLLDDVMKIINRKIQDLHIIKREGKKSSKRKNNIADHKRKVYKKIVHLYKTHEQLQEIKGRVKTMQKIGGTFAVPTLPRCSAAVQDVRHK